MSYKDFLLSNASRITSIESTLRTLTWLLPGRFQDAELASEALYAALNLLSLYHDRIIANAATSLPSSHKPALSSHARYTSAWSASSSSYSLLAHALAVISHTELLVEMLARRKLGSRRRWRVVLMLECIKALLRLRLVDLTGRMLVNPPLPERSIDPATLEIQHAAGETSGLAHHSTPSAQAPLPTAFGSAARPPPMDPASSLTWTGKRTGIAHPSIASLRSRPHDPLRSSDQRPTEGARSLVNDYLSRRALTLEEVLKPLELVRKLQTNKARLAELIWILRPVIYVLAITRYGRRHPAPLLCSLSIEYLSFSLRQASLQEPRPLFTSPRRAAFQNFVSALERTELGARKKAFWAYLLRGPIWALWTRPRLHALADKLADKPLLSLAATAIQDYTPLIDEYHYYTS